MFEERTVEPVGCKGQPDGFSSNRRVPGYSVDIDQAGDTVVFGAWYFEQDDSSNQDSGMVAVYDFTNGDWSQRGSNLYGLTQKDGTISALGLRFQLVHRATSSQSPRETTPT